MSFIAEFIDELTDVIALLTAECADNIVVCGDLNCPGPLPDQVDARLAAAFNSLGLSVLVNAATRDESLLDVLASSLSGVDVDDAGQISNHRLVTARLVVHNPGLPWGWHFNPHTNPIPTGIPIEIPMGIPIPTEPEVCTLLHVGLPSPIGRILAVC